MKNDRKKYKLYLDLMLIVICIGCGMMMYQAAGLSIDAHHDGAVFNPALAVSRGSILFREVPTQYGALTVYTQALFIKIFGESIWSIRLGTIIFYTMDFIAFYLVFKRIIPARLAAIGGIILFYMASFWELHFYAWSSVYALFFQLMTIYCFIRFIEEGNAKWILCGGGLTAVAFWYRQPVGITLLLGGLIAIVLMYFFYKKRANSIKQLVFSYCIAFIIPTILMIGVFLIQDSVVEWWNMSIKGAFEFAFGSNSIKQGSAIAESNNNIMMIANNRVFLMIAKLLKTLFPMGKTAQIYFILPVVGLGVFCREFYRFKIKGDTENSEKNMILWITCLFALSGWHQYFPVSEEAHWFWGGFILFGVFVTEIFNLFFNYQSSMRIFLVSAVIVILVSGTIYDSRVKYQERKEKFCVKLDEREYPYLAHLKLSEEQAEFYIDYCTIMETLQEAHPNKVVNNYSFSTLLSVFQENNRQGTEPPIIVSNHTDPDYYDNYFLAVRLDQKYPEQETDSRIWSVSIYLPN